MLNSVIMVNGFTRRGINIQFFSTTR